MSNESIFVVKLEFLAGRAAGLVGPGHGKAAAAALKLGLYCSLISNSMASSVYGHHPIKESSI